MCWYRSWPCANILSAAVLSLSHSAFSSLFTYSHTFTIACTCCSDEIKGTQDLKISHAHSLILSHSAFREYSNSKPGMKRQSTNIAHCSVLPPCPHRALTFLLLSLCTLESHTPHMLWPTQILALERSQPTDTFSPLCPQIGVCRG